LRDPGDVYWYEFPDEIGSHPTVVVSRATNRNSVLVAMITSKPQAESDDTLPLAGLDCERFVKGFVRADLLSTIRRDDPFWRKYIGRMSEEDLKKVRICVCAAVGIRL
jgi:mRNA-degrading endonuclease toxin of MazEF toxin-antitoxin module